MSCARIERFLEGPADSDTSSEQDTPVIWHMMMQLRRTWVEIVDFQQGAMDIKWKERT